MTEKNIEPEIRFKEFQNNWEKRKIGDITDCYSGGTPNVSNKHFYGGTIPFIRSGEINSHSTELFLTEFGLQNSSAKLVEKGDILYALYGATSGEVGISNITGAINQAILAIKPQKKYDTYYLAQWLRKQKYSIINTYLQGGQGNLSGNIVKDLEVKIPSYDEQTKIGNYFQKLDHLITQHQHKYDKLLKLKKAMLEKMFPKNGAAVPEIRFEGFSEDWKEWKLGAIGSTYTGLSGKTKDDFGHGTGKFVTYMNVFSNPISNRNMTEPIEIDKNQNEVQFGDVFFTTSSETPEEVGMSSIWLDNSDNIYLNSFCFGYRLTKKIDNYYLAYLLRSPFIRRKITFLAQGISRYNISKNKVMEIFIPIPKINEQMQIGKYFKNLDNLLTLHQQKLEKLKKIKKACLEKMFV